MRVQTIEAIPLAYPEPNDTGADRHLCLVRVTTDDGLVGWGEAITMWREATLATAAIIEGMAPLVIGTSPLDTERVWHRLRAHSWWYGRGGIASFAIAALDIALWDLKGKALGARVVDLLGGPVHDRLPAIIASHASLPTIEALAAEAAGWMKAGLHGIKVGFGKRGEARLGVDHDRDVAFVRALREALGPDKRIMVDVGTTVQWDVATAIRRVRAMEPYGLDWIEEPIGPDDPVGYAQLRAHTTTPIAYGEREWTPEGYQRLLAGGPVDIVGVDPGRAEGITGFKKISEQVALAQREINAHAWSSAIITAAALAVCLNSPVCRQFEVKPQPDPMQYDLVEHPLAPVDGWLAAPEGPGLGVTVREEVVARYRYPNGKRGRR